MQAGVIDAQENMLSNIYGRRLHEVSDFLIATRHQQSYVTVMINEDFWQGLEPAQQEAIQAAVDAGTEAADAAAREENKRIVEDITASGVELVEPDESFRQGALPVVEKAAKDILAEGVWQAAVEAADSGPN
jgi:TRAP-type C4-dicarboxylate transport system substrate-binding protein